MKMEPYPQMSPYADVPPILFRQVTVYPDDGNGRPDDTVLFTDSIGRIWQITDAETCCLPDRELAIRFAAGSLTGKIEETGFCNAAELYEQYDLVIGTILHQGMPKIACPETAPAAGVPHTDYYAMYDEYNALYGDVRDDIVRVCIGRAHGGVQDPADNDTVTAVCKWLMTSARKKE